MFVLIIGIILILLGLAPDNFLCKEVKGGYAPFKLLGDFEISSSGKFVKFSTFEEFQKLMSKQKVFIRQNGKVIPVDNAYQYADDTALSMTPFLRDWQNSNLRKILLPQSNIFDIGMGTGRSAPLWLEKKANVWGVEPEHRNFTRLPNFIKEARCQSGDDEVESWIKPESMDYVTMQSSITFFFESDKKLQKLINNINYMLKKGGKLIIVGMDGSKVVTGDNSVYKIIKKGKKINITVKNPHGLVHDQTEYLTDFNKLTKLLGKENINLDKKEYANPPPYLGPHASDFVRSQTLLTFTKL